MRLGMGERYARRKDERHEVFKIGLCEIHQGHASSHRRIPRGFLIVPCGNQGTTRQQRTRRYDARTAKAEHRNALSCKTRNGCHGVT